MRQWMDDDAAFAKLIYSRPVLIWNSIDCSNTIRNLVVGGGGVYATTMLDDFPTDLLSCIYPGTWRVSLTGRIRLYHIGVFDLPAATIVIALLNVVSWQMWPELYVPKSPWTQEPITDSTGSTGSWLP